MRYRLDELDRRLISLLRANGREPVARLAQRLDVTRTTVTRRLQRLIDSGAIAGFSVRVHDDAAASSVRAVMMIAVEGRDARDVVAGLRGIPEIAALHTTNGRWDLIAELSCDGLATLDGVLSTVRALGGVRDSETSILLSPASLT